MLSYTIDTVLLTAALMLLTILPGAMFANGWLTTKLVLVVVYVVLGTFALKRGRTPRVRGDLLSRRAAGVRHDHRHRAGAPPAGLAPAVHELKAARHAVALTQVMGRNPGRF